MELDSSANLENDDVETALSNIKTQMCLEMTKFQEKIHNVISYECNNFMENQKQKEMKLEASLLEKIKNLRFELETALLEIEKLKKLNLNLRREVDDQEKNQEKIELLTKDIQKYKKDNALLKFELLDLKKVLNNIENQFHRKPTQQTILNTTIESLVPSSGSQKTTSIIDPPESRHMPKIKETFIHGVTEATSSTESEKNCNVNSFLQNKSDSNNNNRTSGCLFPLRIDESSDDDDEDDDDDDNNNCNKKAIEYDEVKIQSVVKTPITGSHHWKKLWDDKLLKLENGFLKLYMYSVEKAKEEGSSIQAINLTQKSGFTLRTEIQANDAPKTVPSKLKNIFIIEESSLSALNVSPEQMVIMAPSKTVKEDWIEKIKTIKKITSRKNKQQILTKTILRFGRNPLNYNCIVELNLNNKDILLLGSQEGLYCLDRFNRMSLLRGVMFIKKLSVHENMGLAIMIAGEDPKLVSCDLRQLKSDAMAADCSRPAITTKNILNGTGSCHFYQIKDDLLFAATGSSVVLLKWQKNDEYDEFILLREVATGETCCCTIFLNEKLIFGCQSFYQLRLNDYKVHHFPKDKSHITALTNGPGNICPVDVFNVGTFRNGTMELLLCYNEFGVFIDEHGQKSRNVNPIWKHSPTSFAFRKPYLYIISCTTVDIIKLTAHAYQHESNVTLQESVSYSKLKYLGFAGKHGIYFSNSTSTLDIKKIDTVI